MHSLTAGISSTGGRVCNLHGVNLSGFRKPFCGRRQTIRSPVNDNHTTSPADVETVTFVGKPFFSTRCVVPRTASALGSYIWCIASSRSSFHIPLTTITSQFLHYSGVHRTRKPVRFLSGPSTRVGAKIHAYSGIFDTQCVSTSSRSVLI